MAESTTAPLVMIQRLRAALADDVPLPDEDRQAICDGLDCYLTMRCESLDSALGVGRRQGERDARTRRDLAERDDQLIRAMAEFDLSSPQMAAEMRRYYARGWQRDRAAAECPPQHSGKLEAALWRILKLRAQPLGERFIRAIAARN